MKISWHDFSALLIPRFSWIQVEVTSFCNAACRYCPGTVYGKAWHKRHLPLDTFQLLLPALSRAKLTYLQGWGEPFLHPDFFSLLSLAKKAGYRVGTTTNGMLLSPERIDLLVNSGLDVIAFSLAGLDDTNDSARRGTNCRQVLETIGSLHRAKIRAGRSRPQINLAYMLLRSGLDELERLPAVLQGLGIAEVVISTLDFVAARELEAETLPGPDPKEYDELSRRSKEIRTMGPCFWWGPACFLPAIMATFMLVGLAICLYLIFRRGGFCCPRQGWENSSTPVSEIKKTCCAKGEIIKQKEKNNRE